MFPLSKAEKKECDKKSVWKIYVKAYNWDMLDEEENP